MNRKAALWGSISRKSHRAGTEMEVPLSVQGFLERVNKLQDPSGVSEYRLIPRLPSELLRSSLWDAVWLASLWRFRRGRPYVVAAMDEDRLVERYGTADILYIQSLPRLSFTGGDCLQSGRSVGVDDVSPFIPESEDEFLLFLPDPPRTELIDSPDAITGLDAVRVSRLAECIVVETLDPSLMDFLDALHEWKGEP